MSELQEKVKTSIERLKAFEPDEGYYLAFSGGKDSVVIKALSDMAGVKYDAHYRLTSVDPPELVRFIRDKHSDVDVSIPVYADGTRKTMWNLIPKKLMPPTRLVRYCCSELKEDGGDGRMTITGVRWAESVNRAKNHGPITVMSKRTGLEDDPNFRVAKQGGVILVNDNADSRRMIESCYKRHKTTVNPIIDWTDRDVWDFIRGETIPYCELYDEGWNRLGCIGCPMARQHSREREFMRWPGYKKLYIRAFDKMLEEREKRGKMDSSWRSGNTGVDIFRWWMEYDVLPNQLNLEGFDDV